MAITALVQGEFFDGEDGDRKVIRLAPVITPDNAPRRGVWTVEEHDRFLQALQLYPKGPWRVIAGHVGTKTTRQTMTHAQKYRQKIARMKKGMPMRVARTGVHHQKAASVGSPEHLTLEEPESIEETPLRAEEMEDLIDLDDTDVDFSLNDAEMDEILAMDPYFLSVALEDYEPLELALQ